MDLSLPGWLNPGHWRRIRPTPGPVVLGRRRIYIVPTKAGLVFATIVLAMLIGATNYGNNLVFGLAFLLASTGFLSMLHAYRNLAGLTVRAGHPEPVFAGESARFPLALASRIDRTRYAVATVSGKRMPLVGDVSAMGTTWREIALPTTRRGRLPLGRVTLFTRYPLGLFHAWAYVDLDVTCLVYPDPAGEAALPPLGGTGAPLEAPTGNGGDDFVGLRPYQPGDAVTRIHWKALARGQALLVKRFGGEAGRELWLEWEAVPGRDLEQRLSQLCRWVLEAEAAGARYGLVLPDLRLPLDQGPAHRDRCLEALALFGEVR